MDSDRVTEDLQKHLQRDVGEQRARTYWKIFEQLRNELGYADYLGALQRYRNDYPHDLRILTVSHFLLNYPFANRLFPNALDALEHVKRWGPVGILSDGDVVFQPLKVECSGLSEAVDGRVMIYVHKEKELKDIERRYPSDHYVMIDDKLRILAAMKKTWKTRLTTIFVQQGHYALDPRLLARYPAADVTIQRIGDLLNYELEGVHRARRKTRK